MEKMLNDLLTVSKLELGSITLDCEEVLVSDFMAYANEVGKGLEKVDFDYEIIDNSKGNPRLYIDTDRFTRVIDNIVSNSIKYKRPNTKGKIILSVSEYEHSVIFELADNGMGVDSESLPKIFDTMLAFSSIVIFSPRFVAFFVVLRRYILYSTPFPVV